MRVTIYARYSSANLRDASIADNVRICKAYIEREGSARLNLQGAKTPTAGTLRPVPSQNRDSPIPASVLLARLAA